MPPIKSKASALANRIIAVLGELGVTQTAVQVLPFSQAILDAEESMERWEKLLRVAEKRPTTDILKWITEAQKSGDLDEALWRGFLAGHFGRPSANNAKLERVNSAGRFLCGFGTQPMWTWERVSSDLSSDLMPKFCNELIAGFDRVC